MSEKHHSGEHRPDPCCQCHEALEKRVDAHSEKIEAHDKRLSLGDVGFAEVRKDIHAMTAAISNLANRVELAIAANAVNWSQEVWKAVIFWGVPAVCTGLFYSIVHSGALK